MLKSYINELLDLPYIQNNFFEQLPGSSNRGHGEDIEQLTKYLFLNREVQWRYAYLLHFYDIWYGIRMLWYAISMLCYEIFKNDMIWYAIVWYGMLRYEI